MDEEATERLRAPVVADMPFGSYQASPAQALDTAAGQPFDLSSAPLFRAGLLRLGTDDAILLTVDEAGFIYPNYPGGPSMGADHPIAWFKEYDGGRSFYTNLGHRPESWADPRISEPQLPIYAALAFPDRAVAAVALARVTREDPAFLGVAEDTGLLPGVAALDDQRRRFGAADFPDWPTLRACWAERIREVAREVKQGAAAVGGAASTDATRAALVPYLARVSQEWSAERLPPAFAHALLEGLRQGALADQQQAKIGWQRRERHIGQSRWTFALRQPVRSPAGCRGGHVSGHGDPA